MKVRLKEEEDKEVTPLVADSSGNQVLSKREQKRLERQRKRDEKKQSRREVKFKCADNDKVCRKYVKLN